MRRLLAVYRSSFSGLPRTVWILSAATLVNRSGTMVLPFLALYLTREHGWSIVQAGGALSLYGVGAIGGALLGGWSSERFGSRPVQVASLAANGVLLFVLGAVERHESILAALAVLSVVAEAFRPANGTAVAEASAPEQRSRAFALNRLAVNLGMTIGPVVGGFLAVRDYSWLFVVDGATCLLAALLLLRLGRSDARPRAERAPGAPLGVSPWRDPFFLTACGLLFALATVLFQIQGTWSLYLRDSLGIAEDGIGLVLAVNTAGVVLFEMVSVHLLQGRATLRVMAAGALLMCTGFGILPLGHGPVWVGLTVLVWTAGEILYMPFANAFVAGRAGPGRLGSYMALFTMSFSAAFVTAPAVGTLVFERAGPDALWYGCGAVGVILGAAHLALARSKSAQILSAPPLSSESLLD